MIVCRVLGPAEVRVGDGPAPADLLWRKNLALLVYLARSPGRKRAREHLTGLLWGEKPEAAARHSLNEALRTIRAYAGDAAVDTGGGQVRLTDNAVRLDTEMLEEHVSDGDWEAAGALVVGEFMEGFAVAGAWDFEEWLAAERSTWKRRGVEVLCDLASERLDRGDAAAAAETAQRALRLDPVSATACRVAMRALSLAGDRAAAISTFETFADRLAELAGLEPDAETADLAGRVRRERTWRTPAAAGPVAPAISRRGPLEEREAELSRALATWQVCRDRSRGSVLVVEGEAGVGKTRFLEEIVARTRLDGAVTVQVRAVETDAHAPWSTAAVILRALVSAAPSLLEHMPGRARVQALVSGSAGEAAWSARTLANAIVAAADETAVVLVVDDSHLADSESLAALDATLRDAAERPVLVACAATSHTSRRELEELRSRIGRELNGATIALGPLSAEGLRSLVRWAFPAYADSEVDRLARRIGLDSAGLPLLAVELVHAVSLGLDLRAVQGSWPEPFRTLDQTYPALLPDAITAALRLGFRRLSKDAREVLVAASILGDRVSPEVLARAAGLAADRTDQALDELEWARWLASEPRGYSFVARIAREVVAQDMLTSGKRRRILAAAAESADATS